MYIVYSLWCATGKTQHCKAIILQFETNKQTKNAPKRSSIGTALIGLNLMSSVFSLVFSVLCFL